MFRVATVLVRTLGAIHHKGEDIALNPITVCFQCASIFNYDTFFSDRQGIPLGTTAPGDTGDLRESRGHYGDCEWLFVHAYGKTIARNSGKHGFEWPTDYRPIFVLSIGGGQFSPHFDATAWQVSGNLALPIQ